MKCLINWRGSSLLVVGVELQNKKNKQTNCEHDLIGKGLSTGGCGGLYRYRLFALVFEW